MLYCFIYLFLHDIFQISWVTFPFILIKTFPYLVILIDNQICVHLKQNEGKLLLINQLISINWANFYTSRLMAVNSKLHFAQYCVTPNTVEKFKGYSLQTWPEASHNYVLCNDLQEGRILIGR